MAEIKELGESLLARSQKRNDDRFKRDRKEGYKVALATAGGKILSNSLKQRTTDFLNSEEMFASRAKQLAGYNDSQTFLFQQQKIDASGKNGEDFYTEQAYSTVKAQADTQIRNGGMSEMNADKYDAYVNNLAREEGAKLWALQQDGYTAAKGVESPESFAEFQRMAAARTGSSANVLINGVKKLFGGASRQELEQQTIKAIASSPAMLSAEAASAARDAYNSTGSIRIGTKVADAVASGKLKAGEGRPLTFKNIGTPTQTKTPDGRTMLTAVFAQTDASGNIMAGEDDRPVTFTDTTMLGETLSVDASLSEFVENLSEGEVTTQANIFQQSAMSGRNAQIVQGFAERFEDGTDQLIQITAGMANQIKARVGFNGQAAQMVASQVSINRLDQGNVPGGLFSSDTYDFRGVQSGAATGLESLNAWTQMELNGVAPDITFEELGKMVGSLASDIGKLDPSSYDEVVTSLLDPSGVYSYLHATNNAGESGIDVIMENLGVQKQFGPPTPEGFKVSVPVDPKKEIVEEPTKRGSFMSRLGENFGSAAITTGEKVGEVASELPRLGVAAATAIPATLMTAKMAIERGATDFTSGVDTAFGNEEKDITAGLEEAIRMSDPVAFVSAANDKVKSFTKENMPGLEKLPAATKRETLRLAGMLAQEFADLGQEEFSTTGIEATAEKLSLRASRQIESFRKEISRSANLDAAAIEASNKFLDDLGTVVLDTYKMLLPPMISPLSPRSLSPLAPPIPGF